MPAGIKLGNAACCPRHWSTYALNMTYSQMLPSSLRKMYLGLPSIFHLLPSAHVPPLFQTLSRCLAWSAIPLQWDNTHSCCTLGTHFKPEVSLSVLRSGYGSRSCSLATKHCIFGMLVPRIWHISTEQWKLDSFLSHGCWIDDKALWTPYIPKMEKVLSPIWREIWEAAVCLEQIEVIFLPKHEDQK